MKKIDILAIYDVIIRNNIKSDLQLCALAQAEIDDGKHDFAIFVLKKNWEKSERNNQNCMEDAKWESENPKNEQNPYGYFRGTFPQRVRLFGWVAEVGKQDFGI